MDVTLYGVKMSAIDRFTLDIPVKVLFLAVVKVGDVKSARKDEFLNENERETSLFVRLCCTGDSVGKGDFKISALWSMD